MKKISLIAASVAACALSSTAMAATSQDSGWFAGLAYGQSHLNVSQKPAGTAKANSLNNYGVRGGVYTNPNTRLYATYTYGKDSSGGTDAKNQTLLFSADYLFGDQVAKPFVGVSLGGNQYKVAPTGVSSDEDIDFTYGAQAGINWAVSSNIALEVGYQYLENNNSTKKTASDNTVYKSDLNHSENVYASIDYRF